MNTGTLNRLEAHRDASATELRDAERAAADAEGAAEEAERLAATRPARIG